MATACCSGLAEATWRVRTKTYTGKLVLGCCARLVLRSKSERRNHLLSHIRRQRNRGDRTGPGTGTRATKSTSSATRTPSAWMSKRLASTTTRLRFPIIRCSVSAYCWLWLRAWRRWRSLTGWTFCTCTTRFRIPSQRCWRSRCCGETAASVHHHAARDRHHAGGSGPFVFSDHEILD